MTPNENNVIEEENVINVSDLKIDSSPTNKSDSPNKRLVNFDFTRLPFLNKEDIPKDIDILDNILQYVSYSSTECRHDSTRPLNLIWDLNNQINMFVTFLFINILLKENWILCLR